MLEQLIASIGDRRDKRKTRYNQILDPMDSAAKMDELQQSSIGDPADAGPERVSSMPVMGGGKAEAEPMIQTAAGSNDQSTVSNTQCPGGVCPTDIGSLAQNMGGQTVVGQPSTPFAQGGTDSISNIRTYANNIRNSAENARQRGFNSTAAGMMAKAAEIELTAEQLSQSREGGEQGIQMSKQAYSDQEPARRQSTFEGRQDITEDYAESVRAIKMLPTDFASKKLSLWIADNTQATETAGGAMAPDQASTESAKQQFLAEGYVNQGIGLILMADKIKRSTYDDVEDLLPTPANEGDMEFSEDRNAMMNDGIAAIFDGFEENGILTDRDSMDQILRGTVYPGMIIGLTAKHTASMEPGTPEYEEGESVALKEFGLLRDEMMVMYDKRLEEYKQNPNSFQGFINSFMGGKRNIGAVPNYEGQTRQQAEEEPDASFMPQPAKIGY